MELTGKRILITGGNRGIGYAMAELFGKLGAKVLITGRSEALLAEASEKLGGIPYAVLDMENVGAFPAKVAEIAEKLGGLDAAVNNAGIVADSDRKGVFEVTEEDWDRTMDINLKGLFFLSREIARWMIDHQVKGRMVNICSNTGFHPGTMAYSTSKWGVRGLTMGLGRCWAREGILVNGIAPGPTSTRLMFTDDGETYLRKDIPIGRYSYPGEIAELAAFLLSDTVSNIAGEVIVADGGEL